MKLADYKALTPEAKAARAEAIVKYVADKDNEPSDLRDAAHEAHHALSVKLRGSWERERLNRAMEKRGRVYLFRSEIESRAVEQLVCDALDVKTERDLEGWALVSCMEAIKMSRLDIGPPGRMAEAVRRAMKHPNVVASAEKILALGA